jgi:DNA repair exonuclease SbcCD ATPase subunit
MADVASVKEHLETLLQQELEKKTKILQSKDSAFKELQTNLSAKVHDLETQLGAKNAFLNQRNAELDALTAQLTKMGSSKKEVEALLRQELAKMTELLEAKDATIGELEESLNRAVEGLRNRLREQETLLKSRDETIEALRSEIVGLKSPPAKPASDMLPMEVLTEGPAKAIAKQPDKNLERVQKLETLLNEKEDLVKVHQGKIERLESELKEKRTELARREIAVWQAIERREIWKRRLARFGIPVKD